MGMPTSGGSFQVDFEIWNHRFTTLRVVFELSTDSDAAVTPPHTGFHAQCFVVVALGPIKTGKDHGDADVSGSRLDGRVEPARAPTAAA